MSIGILSLINSRNIFVTWTNLSMNAVISALTKDPVSALINWILPHQYQSSLEQIARRHMVGILPGPFPSAAASYHWFTGLETYGGSLIRMIGPQSATLHVDDISWPYRWNTTLHSTMWLISRKSCLSLKFPNGFEIDFPLSCLLLCEVAVVKGKLSFWFGADFTATQNKVKSYSF